MLLMQQHQKEGGERLWQARFKYIWKKMWLKDYFFLFSLYTINTGVEKKWAKSRGGKKERGLNLVTHEHEDIVGGGHRK